MIALRTDARARVTVEPPLTTITLDRPDVLNAMDLALVEDLAAAVDEARAHDESRVIVVSGAGRAFCAGIDLDMLADAGMPAGFYETQERALKALELANQITVAALHGHCLGGGLQIAIACDIRVCSSDCRLGLPALEEGLFPGMAPHRLPRLIGLAAARRLILSGETVGADEALRLGLVDHVVPAEDFSEGLSAALEPYVRAPRTASAAAKRLLREALDVPREVSYLRSVPLLAECLESPEAALARAERRARRDP